VVLLPLLAFFPMIAAGLAAAGRFPSGPVTIGVDQAVIVALSPALALEIILNFRAFTHWG
jgi:hypothetical protein